MTYDNRHFFDITTGEYTRDDLHPAERKLLAHFHGRWHDVRMLDLGVGTGRTAFTFAPLVKEYVGIDYSQPMIDICRRRFGESPAVQFVVADATDLSAFDGRQFDLILFSYNGIDYVDEAGRLAILRGVRHLLNSDGGVFLFSTHSLLNYPFAFEAPPFRLARPLRSAVARVRHWLFMRRVARVNRGVPAEEAHRKGVAFLHDDGDRRLLTCYVLPHYQLEQLKQCGFEVVSLLNHSGETVSPDAPGRDEWLHYLCRAGRGSLPTTRRPS